MLSLIAALALSTIVDFSHPSLLVSKNTTTTLAGNGSSYGPRLAKNGRLVFFESNSTTLVPNDAQTDRDIYLFDRTKKTLELVMLGDANTDPNGDCYLSSVSSNGRYVAFDSPAANIVAGLSPMGIQSYVHDRKTGKTVLASATTLGAPIAGSIFNTSLSANGRYHVFTTLASNVVPGVATGLLQTYLRDLKLGTTEIVSVGFNSSPANGDCYSPKVSNDGRYVFFTSHGSTLVPVDTNGDTDVFVRDRKLHMTLRAALGANGELADGARAFQITPNGKTIFFTSDSDVLGDGSDVYAGLYVRDMKTGAVDAAAREYTGDVVGGLDNGDFAVSASGRYVTFATYYNSIVNPDPSGGKRDAFYADRKNGTVKIASFGMGGVGINADCAHLAISASGHTLAFNSDATNLTATATNGKSQVYFTQP